MANRMISNWPRQGSLLWIGHPEPDLDGSVIFQFARSVICQQDQRNLDLFDAKTHPDFCLIEPESGSHWIKVDQIRSLIQWAATRPQISPQKVAVIYPAEALNLQAANALLKIMEESMPELLFIFITSQPKRLPDTLRSRCHWIRDNHSIRENKIQQVNVDDSLKTQVHHDLNRLRSREIDPVMLAATWLKKDLELILTALFMIVRESLKQSVQAGDRRGARAILSFLDILNEAKRCVQEKSQVNTQLLTETVLIQYANNMVFKL